MCVSIFCVLLGLPCMGTTSLVYTVDRLYFFLYYNCMAVCMYVCSPENMCQLPFVCVCKCLFVLILSSLCTVLVIALRYELKTVLVGNK